jgi:hypothetical protein
MRQAQTLLLSIQMIYCFNTLKKHTMKFIISLSITILLSFHLSAQQNNIIKLKKYTTNSSIKIIANYCILSCGKTIDTIIVYNNQNNLLSLKNKKDSIALKTLLFSSDNILELQQLIDTNAIFKKAKLSILEAVINKAVETNGELKFINDKPDEDATEKTSIVTVNNSIQEDDLQPKENNKVNWIAIVLGAILALVTALLLLEKKEKVKKNASIQSDDATKQIVQLQNTNQHLMQQLQLLQLQLHSEKDKDSAYFSNALQQFVNPIKAALTKQNKSEVAALAMQIIVQYIAYTHYKTDRLQGSDIHNLQNTSGSKLFGTSANQQIISHTTAIDALPIEIKTMLELVESCGAELPKNLAYMGYQWI